MEETNLIKQFLENNQIDTTYLKNRTLHILVSKHDEASKVYVGKKVELAKKYGMLSNVIEAYDIDSLIGIKSLIAENVFSGDALICQYPCSDIVDEYVKYHMSSDIDIDGLSKDNASALYRQETPLYQPCTSYGVTKFIEYLDLPNKNIGIIGRSELVGRPLRATLERLGYTVFLAHSKSDKRIYQAMVRHCDIIVTATGHDFSTEAYKQLLSKQEKRYVIDVGMRRDEYGLLGDVTRHQRSNLEYVGHYVTSVPGGVGLLTTWSIFDQLSKDSHADFVKLTRQRSKETLEEYVEKYDDSLSNNTNDYHESTHGDRL